MVMIKFLKKIISILTLAIVIFLWNITYAEIDGFSVDVKDTINIWEPVDFTISAIKDGEIFKEFSWYVLFDIIDKNWNALDSDLYTISSYWYYNFVETDQWIKTFSKWLEIKKAWKYTLTVNAYEWVWSWFASINVLWESGTQQSETINIVYPINWSTEAKEYVTVMWSCEKLKNSPVIIYLNDKVAWSGYTDAKWEFNILVSNLVSWGNEIQAKIVDINNLVLGESPVVSIKYQNLEDERYKGIEILPSNNVKQWDKITLNVKTEDSINSAQLILSNFKRNWGNIYMKSRYFSFFIRKFWRKNLWESRYNFSKRICLSKKYKVYNYGCRLISSSSILGDYMKYPQISNHLLNREKRFN